MVNNGLYADQESSMKKRTAMSQVPNLCKGRKKFNVHHRKI